MSAVKQELVSDDTMFPSSPPSEVQHLRRITKDFAALVGKTIVRVCWGGQFFGLVFSDNTFVFLDAYQFAMHYEQQIEGHWKVQLGLMDEAVLRRQEAEQKRRADEHIEKYEREAYERLKKKFEPKATGAAP